MAEGENEFKFVVMTNNGVNETFDANIVFPKNFTTRDSDGQHDPVMVEVSAESVGDSSRAEVDPGDMGAISIKLRRMRMVWCLTCLRIKLLLYMVRRRSLFFLTCVVVLRIRMRIFLR